MYVHTTDKLVHIYVKVGGLASLAAIPSSTALAPPTWTVCEANGAATTMHSAWAYVYWGGKDVRDYSKELLVRIPSASHPLVRHLHRSTHTLLTARWCGMFRQQAWQGFHRGNGRGTV